MLRFLGATPQKKTKQLLFDSLLFVLLVNIYSSKNASALSSSGTTPTNQNYNVTTKGRCPDPKMDHKLCTQPQIDQCVDHDQCSGESLCCSTGCSRVCVLPLNTACENVRSSAERRARALEANDAADVQVPACDPVTGHFKEVQCGPKGCFCVDAQGFELPGTRARSLQFVNCSNPNPKCDGPMCRMLCPSGFELDEDGCEICECRNVCKGVKCPGSEECEVEELPCSASPCPPTPQCKTPRSLDSLCPFGAPLMIPESGSGSPFLCGTGPGQPTCPAAFECNVQTGNDYGVCCASNRNFEKPGSCPVVAQTDSETSESCPSSCRTDLDCSASDKCCFTQGCGKQCSAPANSSACLQQKHVAELLSAKELDGRGYIPICDDAGNFVPKQCSTNGKVCWCVDPSGKNFPASLGPSASVNCSLTQKRDRSSSRSDDSYTSDISTDCDRVICPPTVVCPYGMVKDRNGCPTCDCVTSPCDGFPCPSESKCSLVQKEGALTPVCLSSSSIFVNPCPLGTPLTDIGDSTRVVTCSQSAAICPSTHICVVVSPNSAGLCCPNRPRIEPTKEGMCPFLAANLCSSNSTSLDISHKKCGTDADCENSMKCCAAGDCTICADPLLQTDLVKDAPPSATMCQYLRDAENKLTGIYSNFRLAKSSPKCKLNGEFQEVQCDSSSCFCVDFYGAEIPGTEMEILGHNLTTEFCAKARLQPKCLDLNCRLACDYGYEMLDGCKICECRNPCMFKAECRPQEKCELVDIDCVDGHCPPLPLCIPVNSETKSIASLACPKGQAFVTEGNETLGCNPRARMLQCPDDYFCHDVVDSEAEFGLCCPIIERSETPANNELGSITTKPGQCPYLLPLSGGSGSCESECETDAHCPSGKKCCLNSCGGSQCVAPLLMTACEHQKKILEHKARESGTPSRRIFIPRCDESGAYERVQYFGQLGWCVDSAGEEIQGTRVSIPNRPNCSKPAVCPQAKCSLDCEFGLKFDPRGCPICECRPSGCDTIRCGSGEECRMVQLSCISEPCPPVPLCLSRLGNPCPTGGPLTFEESGELVTCGPGAGSCPSSHKCNISPFGEYAVCCPKPKDVCLEPKSLGVTCSKPTSTKWAFNTSANECQPFPFSGCGGNSNSFNTKAECLSVCPALSHCERIREKNHQLVSIYHQMSYIPKCNPRNGAWESIQCFEEIGMCWCVNGKGEPIKGTMTNGGVPNCQRRRGRFLASAESSFPEPMVCEPGVTVHKCNKSTCEQKLCLGNPNARCVINPCGGCAPKWVTESGEEVNCTKSLGVCHREMHQIMNSEAWRVQGFSSFSIPEESSAESKIPQDDEEVGDEIPGIWGPIEPFGNVLSKIFHPSELKKSKTRTKVSPIYADLGGGKKRVMGMMSSSVTIISDESSSEEILPKSSKSPVKSIADILADLMTSQSSRSYYSDDLIDLMPSSSSLLPSFPFSSEEQEASGIKRVSRVRRDSEIPDSLAMESSIGGSDEEGNREFLVSILPSPSRKPGSCPFPSQTELFNLLRGSCVDECSYDSECGGDKKCCVASCGLRCISPQSQNEEGRRDSHSEEFQTMQSELLNSYDETEPGTMVVSIPDCDPETGAYSPAQRRGPLEFCVDEAGHPLPETLTRGKVICSQNGTLLHRMPVGPVCPLSNQIPMICKDSCLYSSCPRHPSAVCVMDVCDGCKPSYFMPSGERVQCEEKCQQPMAEAGFCRASILRYTFNSTSGKCEEFIFGGCQGNENNFETMSQCQAECEKTDPDICNLPQKSGPCRASMTRWAFNPLSQTCEEFDYGGCGGNANNFMSKEHCESRCPDLVLCPSITPDGQLNSCSRTTACANVTCPGHQLDDFMCAVDPCTCIATLKDFTGVEVNCNELELKFSPKSKSDDESEIISADPNSEPISSGDNLLLKVLPGLLRPKLSRCQLLSEQNGGFFTCDSSGQFVPRQCIRLVGTEEQCFCVDEAGKDVEGTTNNKNCDFIPVIGVSASLSFPVGDDVSSVQIGTEMQTFLRSLGANIEREAVEVEVLPEATRTNFVLIGPNKIDVSFWLEQLVIGNAIGVEDSKRNFVPADFANSKFNYKRQTKAKLETVEIRPESENEIPVDAQRTKQVENLEVIPSESLFNADAQQSLLLLIAAISAGLVFLGLFLALQNKKGSGSWPKKPFEALAFSSSVYEIEKKAPLKERLATFKVIPYFNNGEGESKT